MVSGDSLTPGSGYEEKRLLRRSPFILHFAEVVFSNSTKASNFCSPWFPAMWLWRLRNAHKSGLNAAFLGSEKKGRLFRNSFLPE